MMSEIVAMKDTSGYWGGAYSDTMTSLGGQTFTGWQRPNSGVADRIGYGGGTTGDFIDMQIPVREFVGTGGGGNDARLTAIIARSRHRGGVNGSRCDGSVSFYSDSISEIVWSALTTARGGTQEPQIPASL
jgi:prepilin-type processing-associated H-X9-DG protein